MYASFLKFKIKCIGQSTFTIQWNNFNTHSLNMEAGQSRSSEYNQNVRNIELLCSEKKLTVRLRTPSKALAFEVSRLRWILIMQHSLHTYFSAVLNSLTYMQMKQEFSMHSQRRSSKQFIFSNSILKKKFSNYVKMKLSLMV